MKKQDGKIDWLDLGVAITIFIIPVGTFIGSVIASITHIKDWAMRHVVEGVGEWQGWQFATVIELIPVFGVLVMWRLQKQGRQSNVPRWIFWVGLCLSMSFQIAYVGDLTAISKIVVAIGPTLLALGATEVLLWLGRRPRTTGQGGPVTSGQGGSTAEAALGHPAGPPALHPRPTAGPLPGRPSEPPVGYPWATDPKPLWATPEPPPAQQPETVMGHPVEPPPADPVGHPEIAAQTPAQPVEPPRPAEVAQPGSDEVAQPGPESRATREPEVAQQPEPAVSHPDGPPAQPNVEPPAQPEKEPPAKPGPKVAQNNPKPLDEKVAHALRLIDEHGFSQRAAVEKSGASRGTVQRAIAARAALADTGQATDEDDEVSREVAGLDEALERVLAEGDTGGHDGQ